MSRDKYKFMVGTQYYSHCKPIELEVKTIREACIALETMLKTREVLENDENLSQYTFIVNPPYLEVLENDIMQKGEVGVAFRTKDHHSIGLYLAMYQSDPSNEDLDKKLEDVFDATLFDQPTEQ